MKRINETTKFRRQLKKSVKRGKSLQKFATTVNLIRCGQTLPPHYKLHRLKGNYKGLWECHMEPDWLLIFDYTDTDIFLIATGTHSDLFL